jgi:hypothetical protein
MSARTRSLIFTAALALLAGAPAQPASAQEPKRPPAPAQETPPQEAPQAAPLEQRYAALVKDAESLCAAYRRAIETRVAALIRGNQTLQRLQEAGIFNADVLTAGISLEDPLTALPYLKRAYEHAGETAAQYAHDFAGLAKERYENGAIAFLKKLAQAQALYREEDRDGNGVVDYAETFAQLGAAGLTTPAGAKAKHEISLDGYRFRIQRADALHWAADAWPEVTGETGDRFFFVDETGIVRASKTGPANEKSEPVK